MSLNITVKHVILVIFQKDYLSCIWKQNIRFDCGIYFEMESTIIFQVVLDAAISASNSDISASFYKN
jgi:hypothetical protein